MSSRSATALSKTPAIQHITQRTLLNIQVPPGKLKIMIASGSLQTRGHVWVASIQDDSPVKENIAPGDWIIAVNGMPVTSRDVGVELFSKTTDSLRTVSISRGNVIARQGAPTQSACKESTASNDLPGAVTPAMFVAPVELAPAAVPPVDKPLPPDTHALLDMTRDELLERLGLPVTQWRQWRKLKIKELKPLLRQRGLAVGGTKHELLTRLGVPVGFGETAEEKWKREASERNKKRRKLEKLLSKVRPEDDPSHEDYEVRCCKFARFNCQGTEPAGMIRFPDGSCMEVWRCLTCGKIPQHPNAPPIQEYSDAEEGKEEAVCGFPFGYQENFFS